ncbi:protein of unknown function [Methylacidimicrobium sp. AP8]|nr:protein of unknown function [Methylacidimicrobium sp. AP8]
MRLTHEQTSCLDAYAALYGRAQRTLFARMRAGVPLNELKRSFLRRFGLTARQFNAIRVELEGKIASIRERRPELIEEAKWGGSGKRKRRSAGWRRSIRDRMSCTRKSGGLPSCGRSSRRFWPIRSPAGSGSVSVPDASSASSLPGKRTAMRTMPHGRRIGRRSGAASSSCSDRRTRPRATSPAKPQSLRTAACGCGCGCRTDGEARANTWCSKACAWPTARRKSSRPSPSAGS